MKTLIFLFSLLSTIIFAQDTLISVDHAEFEKLKKANADLLILDVRSPTEYKSGYIEGAVNSVHTDIKAIQAKIKEGQPVILYCRSGRRAGLVAEQLLERGYSEIYHLKGDMMGWQAAKKPIVQKP